MERKHARNMNDEELDNWYWNGSVKEPNFRDDCSHCDFQLKTKY